MTNSRNSSTSNNSLLLSGLDGSNPLAFLAALGLLRTLSRRSDRVPPLMKWVQSGGMWAPAVWADSARPFDQQALLDALQRVLADDIDTHPILQLLGRLGTDDANERREVFREQFDHASAHARTPTDWLAALASDFAPTDAVNQLQTTRRDYYCGNLTSVLKHTNIDHLRRSVFCPWDYADRLDNQSLHLDPSEDRRHAHQWNKPAGDPARKKSGGMLGANRLAIEAIPLFTSFPEEGTLRTVGFTGNRSTDTRWTWPIWQTALDLSSTASLLSLACIQAQTISSKQRHELHQCGVAAVFRCNRILVQKTPNFTPARRIA
jgi:CRISPR-associated endonuclease/helicase Cas3